MNAVDRYLQLITVLRWSPAAIRLKWAPDRHDEPVSDPSPGKGRAMPVSFGDGRGAIFEVWSR